MEHLKRILPVGTNNQTATLGTAGAGIGFIIVFILQTILGIEITGEQGSGLSTAIGSLTAFLWANFGNK